MSGSTIRNSSPPSRPKNAGSRTAARISRATRLQHFVADRVAVAVVDALEVVDVDDERCARRLRLFPLQQLFEPAEHVAAIRRAGQLVRHRERAHAQRGAALVDRERREQAGEQHREHDQRRLQLARAALLGRAPSRSTSFSRISSSFSFSFAAVSNSTLSEAKRWSSWFFSSRSEVDLVFAQHLEARAPVAELRLHARRAPTCALASSPSASASRKIASASSSERCAVFEPAEPMQRDAAHELDVRREPRVRRLRRAALPRASGYPARARESPAAFATAAMPRSAYASPRA